jgi:multidrug efflux pump subunit AcrB
MTSVGKGNPQVYYNVIPWNRKANVAEIFCALERYDPKTSPALLDDLRARLAGIPGARIVAKEFENGPPIAAPIAIRILGDDLDGLARVAADVERILRATEGTDAVDNPVRVRKTDLRLDIDRPAAALLGVPLVEIDRAARLAVAGLVVSKFREADGDEYDIRLTVPHGERQDLSGWRALHVPSLSGAYVPAGQVAELRFESTPVRIERYNRERAVTVTADVRSGYNTDRLTRRIRDAIAAQGLPPGFRFELAGEFESRQESFGGLSTAILIAVFGIVGVLVVEFKSFRGTLIVASVIPLGVVGGLAALFAAGYTLSFTAVIGFVALVGIEIKNSILLVDFTNQLRAQGVALREAIERAGEVRFLPVVLTTLTALGALTPLALEGSSLYSPLALVIMGGLVSSLLLSRLVTPVMYSLLPPAESA